MPPEVGGGHRQRGLAADPAPSTGARGEPACAAVARDLAIIASNAGALSILPFGLRSKREVVQSGSPEVGPGRVQVQTPIIIRDNTFSSAVQLYRCT